MAIEREIKLTLPDTQIDAARRFLDARAGAPGREITLSNLYFDTPERTLASAHGALRLRHTEQGWLQTFKAANSARDGLHRRYEWELPVAGERLEIDALVAACDVPDAAKTLRRAAPALIALFRTDFTRVLWRINEAHASIEAALDRGEIVASVGNETRRAPICEIELELIDGDEAALHTLASACETALPGLRPDDASKAQRGYQLRGDA